jgi:hypothetical protein
MTNPTTPKKWGRRLYVGCLSLFAFLLVGIIVLVLTVRYIIHSYTDSSLTQLPTVEMPEGQRRELNNRYKAFEKAVDAGVPAPQFRITANEINVLIGDVPDLRGLVYASIEGGQLKGQASIPLDKTGIPFTKGRFLNGVCTFQPSMQNGVLVVTAQSIVVKGKPLPEVIMSRIRPLNLAEKANQDPNNAKPIHRFESFAFEEDTAVIKGKETHP